MVAAGPRALCRLVRRTESAQWRGHRAAPGGKERARESGSRVVVITAAKLVRLREEWPPLAPDRSRRDVQRCSVLASSGAAKRHATHGLRRCCSAPS